jgi:hypothetical protein
MRPQAIFIVLILFGVPSAAQQIKSLGIFAGANTPFTLDEGLASDPRYAPKYIVRTTPFGINIGYDVVDFGALISPNFVVIGQKFHVLNSAGGQIGVRDIRMSYFNLPMAFKYHVTDLSFFRVGILGGIQYSFLINAIDQQSHSEGLLNWPPSLDVPPGYTETYDGVFAPSVTDQVVTPKENFKSSQVFVNAGVRTDFDLTDEFGFSFDFRANYSLFDPRTADYLGQLESGGAVPDLHGRRRDLYFSLWFGVSKLIGGKVDDIRRRQSKNSFSRKGKGKKKR